MSGDAFRDAIAAAVDKSPDGYSLPSRTERADAILAMPEMQAIKNTFRVRFDRGHIFPRLPDSVVDWFLS